MNNTKKTYYCSTCGHKLIRRKSYTGDYDMDTGKPKYVSEWNCNNPKCKNGKIYFCPRKKETGNHGYAGWKFWRWIDTGCEACPY